jgi:hypothetical protein
MMKEEANIIMHTLGWYYQERIRRHNKKYVYAKRRQGPKMIERYICPLSRLEGLTEQQLRAKLAPTT